MDKNERDNIKKSITERFVTALDYLVDSGKIENIKDFERITGIRSQRVTGMRKFLKLSDEDNEKPYYTNADHIYIVHEFFNVSLEYIFKGIKPIVTGIQKESNEVSDNGRSDYKNEKCNDLEEKVNLLSERINLINDKLNFYISRDD